MTAVATQHQPSRDVRLATAMRTNARVRIGTQVLVLLVWVVWVRSPWMAAFFFMRWLPIGLLLVADRKSTRLNSSHT